MTTITVRRPNFEWPPDLPVLPVPSDPSRSCELVALSFTLPYLEPYLIRTMRVAAKQVEDPELRADMKAFSGQEAQHYQQHARINDLVRAQLSDGAATAMRSLEDGLEACYRRFSQEKSLAFNLAYAEGFEAMTFALARSVLTTEGASDADPAWGNLMAWHLAEEIEHRTVTFDAYEAVVGRYTHRVAVGTWAQSHFLRCLLRMAAVLQRDTIDASVPMRKVVSQAARRNWRNGMVPGTLRSILPSYNPRNVPISDEVRLIAATQGVELG
ncbi:MAG: putative metal-dependent hydrolase [Paracrocinitomix sp.]|jgi:predicted metal-dependent hydrolase